LPGGERKHGNEDRFVMATGDLQTAITTPGDPLSLDTEESQRILLALLTTPDQVVVCTDTTGVVLAHNAALAAQTGQPGADLRGWQLHDLLPPEIATTRLARIREAVASETLLQFEDNQDGLWQDHRLHPIHGKDGLVSSVIMLSRDITAQKRDEEALRQSENTLRGLLDTTDDCIFLCNTAGVILTHNTRLAERLGRSGADLRGQCIMDLLPGQIAYARQCFGEQVLVTGQPARFEDCRDGTYFAHYMYPIFAEDGRVDQLAVFSRDITARKQAEAEREEMLAALAHERSQLRTILQTLPVGLLLADAQGQITDTNAIAASIWGSTTSELETALAAQTFQAWWPDSEEPVQPDEWPLTRAVWHGETTLGAVLELQRLDGTRGTIIVNAAPLFDRDGRISGGICLLQDISQVKRLEADLVRERAYLDIALDTLPLPVTFFSPRGDSVWRNRAAEEFGRRLGPRGWADVQTLDPLTRTPIPPEAIPEKQAHRGKCIADFEHILLLPNGQEISMISYAAPIIIEGQVAAVVSAYQDITALKEYDRAKDEFLAILSHELQTPLTSILGWAQLALQRREFGLLEQALDVVQRNARRQKRLIGDLLDMSRLLHRKLELEPEVLDLSQLTRQAVENLQVQAGERHIRLALSACRRPLRIQGDPERLQQCLDNVLQNSLKFTPAGGQITVSCRRRGARAVLSVRDTGRGMAPEDIAAVFAPFRQVERDERTGGLGLGLAVTRGIIELHGGRITATSPGRDLGSTFTIALPMLEGA
jgi:PAS domain S-box-containing protein